MTNPGGGQPNVPGSGAEDTKNIAGELAGWMKNPAGGILGAAFNVLSTIFGKGSTGIAGIIEWVDGQTEYNNRTDLLSPLQDYGSVYMNSGMGLSQNGQVNFSHQIGPMRGCHLSGGRIILGDQGLWDIQCQLWFDYIDLLSERVEWQIRVLWPDGNEFSRTEAIVYERKPIHSTNVASVVVPGPGFQVQTYISAIAPFRGLTGGPSRNRLTVKHISRDTSTGNTGQG